MRTHRVPCTCTDSVTKKHGWRMLCGVGFHKFIFWCRTCCKQFEEPA